MTELRGDRTQAGTALAAGLTLWRYTRMEEGETSLPAEYLRPLAKAYGVPVTTLLEKLDLLDAELSYDPRAAMEAAGTFTAQRIDQVEREVAGKHPAAQKARINAEIALGPDPQAELEERARERQRYVV